MQILAVELENVKSYERAKITFSPGVNAIVGHNGAGKSTILEAIGFVLFDALEYSQDDFIRGGAKSARVRVSFVSNFDERTYDVERRIGSSSAYFVHDPQLGMRLCEGKADVVRFLRQHLQVEPNASLPAIFKDAVGVPQGTLTAAFMLNDANRKRIFDSLLRVEEYSRAWDKLREPMSLLKTRKSEISEQISHLQGKLERVPILEATIAERKQRLDALQDRFISMAQELKDQNAKRDKLQSARDEKARAQLALSDTQGQLQTLKSRHQAAEEARAHAEVAHKLVAENQAGYAAYLEAEKTQKSLEERIRQRQQLDMRRATAEKNVALHQAEVRRQESELEAVAAAEKVVAELHSAVIEQTRLEGVLNEARQQQARLEDAKRTAARQQQELERLQKRHAELERQLAEAQKVEARIQTALAESETQRKHVEEARNKLAMLKSQADLIKEQSQQLKEVQSALCPLCEQPLTEEHRKSVIDRNESRLQAMRDEYRQASALMQKLEAALKQEQDAIETWRGELMRLPRADEAQKLGEEIERSQAALKEANEQVASLAGAAQQLESTTKALEALGDPRTRFTLANEQASRRKSVEEKLLHAQKELDAAQSELEKLQEAVANFGDLDAELEVVAATVRRHREAYQTVLTNQREAAALEERMKAATALAQEVAELTARYLEVERSYQAAAANFDDAAYAEVMLRCETLQREMGTLSGQLDEQKANQARDESELAELLALSKALGDAEEKLKRLIEEEEVLETIRTKLRQAGPYISAALNRQISEGARQIFCDLMQDYSRHLTWNEDYSISLEVDGRERNFSQLSGGEQMSAALAVRLALLREMSSIDIAFFDEPTANLDEVRRESLARQILNVRGFRQLFVISHDDTFQQATQNLIRVARIDGASRVLAD